MCPSQVKGKYIIRFAICAKSSTQEDIDYSWQEIKRCAELVLEESEEFFKKAPAAQLIRQKTTPAMMEQATIATLKNGTKSDEETTATAATLSQLNGSGQQLKLANGKMNASVVLNRSVSDISVVSLPRFNDLKTAYANLLEAAGEDITREGLLKTPERAAKALMFFTGGYHQDLRGKHCCLIAS